MGPPLHRAVLWCLRSTKACTQGMVHMQASRQGAPSAALLSQSAKGACMQWLWGKRSITGGLVFGVSTIGSQHRCKPPYDTSVLSFHIIRLHFLKRLIQCIPQVIFCIEYFGLQVPVNCWPNMLHQIQIWALRGPLMFQNLDPICF